MEFIDLKSQYIKYKNEIDLAMSVVLESANFILGDEVKTFEQNLCNYLNVKNAITCANGTDALLLSLMALDIKKGDEVITSSFSFISCVEAIILLGATPIFVDINEKTYNLDSNKLANAITSKTKAIVPISIFGQMSAMDEINAIAGDIPVIEDAAQSFGASYIKEGKVIKSCNSSLLGITSFFPSKPLGCYGDGGAIFTNDDNLALKIRYLTNHGQVQRYKHKFIGLNSRLDSIQAAILNIKLKYLDEEIQKRQELANIYSLNLDSNLGIPFVLPNHRSVYAQYTIRTKNRDKLISAFLNHKIPYAIHYPIPLHLQEAVLSYTKKQNNLEITELACNEVLSLPFSPFLKQEDQNKVIKIVNENC